MEGMEFEIAVHEYLITEKAYPKAGLQMEAALSPSPDGRIYRADLTVIDTLRSEVVALIEVKKSREHGALRAAISQLLHYRRVLGKPHIPLFLFFPPLNTSARQFEITQVLPDGKTKDIAPAEFPSYDALVSGDTTSRKVAQTVAVRSTVDMFQLTCVGLSLAATVILALDVSEVFQLTTKQLILAGAAAALLILPFAAKFKMLGVEFERHNPTHEPQKMSTSRRPRDTRRTAEPRRYGEEREL